jgi:hypothetical protein
MNSFTRASSTPFRRTAAALLPAAVLIATFAAGGCAAGSAGSTDAAQRERTPDASQRSVEQGYYIVTRQDYRKCMWPHCGGVFVKRVNQAETECLDGSLAAECYVADIDLEPLGLADDVASELDTAATSGKALIRGGLAKLIMQNGEAPVLVASEGWLGRAGSDPTGSFYHVVDSGIVCVTWPCPVLKQVELNVGNPQNISGLDLATSGADDQALAEGQATLSQAGLLVAGSHHATQGPGGEGSVLDASEFYTLAGQAPPPGGDPCGQSICGDGELCCNPSCGICAPLGGACIELACAACAHSVCVEGEPLASGCDQCVGQVCAADPFCCNTAWDDLCVEQAADECGSCGEPEPPAGCDHDECETGVTLDPSCSACANVVCFFDEFCCETAWDELCVQEASAFCSVCD